MSLCFNDLEKIIESINKSRFKLSKRPDHIESEGNGGFYKWKIKIRIIDELTDSDPYALAMFELKINGKEHNIPAKRLKHDKILAVCTVASLTLEHSIRFNYLENF